jgi:hypothetical protein
MRRRSMFAAVAFAALAAVSGFALWAQEPHASYTPEGAWLVKGTFGPGSPTFLWMDNYTSDSTNQRNTGTILCTLPSVTATASGHGVWARIEKNRFAITAWRIRLDPNSQPVGLAKFWGTVTMPAHDTMTGTLNAEFYDLNGNLLNRMLGGTSAGTRIQIQYE